MTVMCMWGAAEAKCPRTWALIAALEGGEGRTVTTAGFSILLPGAHIEPHRDMQVSTSTSTAAHLRHFEM